jgi:hypothetical protein
MADNVPNIPTGAVPPKKETGKVQPKKETVRINLPPKPSAAPTIKLPTLPPGGPGGAPGVTPPPAPAHAPAHAAAVAPAVPRTTAAAPIAQRPMGSLPRPSGAVAGAAVPALSPMDTILAIAAAVVGLLAVASTVYVAFMLGS